MRTHARVALLALTLAAPLGAQSDGRYIRGVISDSSGRRISFASYMTTGQSRYSADSVGAFGIRVPLKGEIGLRFYRIGYEPKMITFESSGDTTIAVVMTPIPRTLEAVEVVTDRSNRRLDAHGFYQRMNDRKKGVGSATFFTANDIADRNPLRITHMLQDVPGVRVIGQGSTGMDGQIRGANNCDYTIYMDGVRIHPRTTEAATASGGQSLSNIMSRTRASTGSGAPGAGGSAGGGQAVDHLLTPNATAGIEVYPRGSGAPPQFSKVGSTCGVVVFWSR